MVEGARNTHGVLFDDTLQDFVMTCLERVGLRLNELDRLDADGTAPQHHQRVRDDMRRELQAAEDAIRMFFR